MSLKKKEFRSLRQGERTVTKYVEEFNKLAHYPPNDVSTDAARQEKFLEGLNDELGVQLTMATFKNCQGSLIKLLCWRGSIRLWSIARGSTTTTTIASTTQDH